MSLIILLNKTISIYKEVILLFIKVKQKNNFLLPYFSQFEDRKLVEKIINKKITAKNDHEWKNSGAESQDEYAFWSHHMCGMACLKMILKKETGKTYPIIKLGKMATEYGCYRVEKDDIPGLFYYPFVKFAKDEFCLKVEVASHLSIQRICFALSKGKYVIASVSPMIRYANDNQLERGIKKGGHLVLMTGYDLDNKVLYLHNPSGFYSHSQENFQISFDDFKKYFAGRGMSIVK